MSGKDQLFLAFSFFTIINAKTRQLGWGREEMKVREYG
jgi:hypothetical protein